MDAKSVVIKAKEILSQMDNVSYLSRDAFIATCTNAAKRFMKKLQREGRQPGGPSPVWAQRDVATLGAIVEEEASAVFKQQRKAALCSTPIGDIPHNPSHDEGSSSNGGSAAGGDRFVQQNAGGEARRFLVLAPQKVEAAAVVKRVIDGAYQQGQLRREHYQDIVLTVVSAIAVEGRCELNVDGSLAAMTVAEIAAAAEQRLGEYLQYYAGENDISNNQIQAAINKISPTKALTGTTKHVAQKADSTALPAQAYVAESAVADDATLLDGSFEDQVAQLKRILHASFETSGADHSSAPTAATATATAVSANNSDPPGAVKPIPREAANPRTTTVAKQQHAVDGTSSVATQRKELLLELQQLHGEAAVLQAKMNIVVRQLLEL